MKLGIAGYGFVGQAHELIFKKSHEIIISDPAKSEYGNLKHADAIIICVSTPSASNGTCDVSNVCSVITEAPDVPILIKSTISPEGWKLITDTFKNKNITFSPEFLRAAHWQEDALNKKDFYFGGDSVGFWSDLFLAALGRINITPAEPEELILMKQLRNSYLALKVTFFNQVYDYCKGEGLNFDNVRKLVTADERIGDSHSFVTKERGFGGHCLPKDTLATVRSSVSSANTRMTLLEESLNYNNSIQKDNSQD